MNKNMIKAVLAGSAFAAMALGTTAAQAATADGTASATILTQVTVTNSSALNFGTIAIGTSGGNVTISTAGARTCGSGLVCSGATTAAGFTVNGVTGQTVGVSVPGSVTLTETGGATMSATLSSSAASIVLDGTDAFTVGGVLGVGGTQTAGAYSGLFTVTVNYQ